MPVADGDRWSEGGEGAPGVVWGLGLFSQPALRSGRAGSGRHKETRFLRPGPEASGPVMVAGTRRRAPGEPSRASEGGAGPVWPRVSTQ